MSGEALGVEGGKLTYRLAALTQRVAYFNLGE